MKTEKQIAAAAAEFAERWRGKGDEKSESQLFWTDLLQNVFGVEDVASFIRYEERVKVDNTNFIDGHIPSTRVLIEQKSIDKDLRKGIVQSNGAVLNPFQQARKYVSGMPLSQHPRWIVTCNFQEFLVYDMEQPNGEPQQILLKDLGKEYYRLMFLVNEKSEHLSKEEQVSFDAGKIVARIHDALMKQYADDSPEALRWLNILCVRIVFCLYAEDAGAFHHDQFHDYLSRYEAEDMRRALRDLFEVLNTPMEKRSRYLKDDLKAFPYTNGGLFEEEIEIPQFTEELRQVLLQNASLDFDWSEISPTIFGAVFESTLNPETRRSGGMHYTSIQNIHKVIAPLFLNDLRRELDDILEEPVERQRQKKLDAYQEKLASLAFLDPACGSGNFLTETYLSLRRLENEVIRERYHGQSFFSFDYDHLIKVSIQQFYGIEINDFAVAVATTALWISEAQMLAETEKIIGRDLDFLPLKSYTNIREGNALRMDWESIAPANLNYIMGNPPFVGARLMSSEQKQDVLDIFGEKWKNVGNLDYVCCWYKKAAELMKDKPQARAALVSTNSICQGEQVANLWQPLMEEGLQINFAHRTFRWDSESNLKAHVHCVIVGFSYFDNKERVIYDNDKTIKASHINGYLTDAPDIFIESRKRPICDVPEIGMGNQPIDGGNYIFDKEEMEEFIRKEPLSANLFHPYYGAYEFINQKTRYCLWLGDCSPAELRKMPHCMKRIEAVRDARLASKRASTLKLADKPTRFQTENFPKGDYIVIPEVSSEKRRYIPMGIMSDEVICSNKLRIMPNVSLYHFGVLQSNVHMAWMRAVAGRLEMRYDYSIAIVYNNFPWPTPTDEQRKKIEQTAQAILDARAIYPDASLADLYDELSMPPELRKAHQDNDRAVMQAYGFPVKSTFTESQCVAELFKLYKELTK
ncbi:MAG: class I SAM-dependent DNA methyltransferase [Bacteroidaceae bacterium]|nr:class I SAM-dependent DNA methyltransferase [Bacteroidaceae bacterium]